MNQTPSLLSCTSQLAATNSLTANTKDLSKADACKEKYLPKYRMVALDLDGTLLGSNRQVALSQATYLKSLHDRGFTVCIATGRAPTGVYSHVKTLNIDPIPVVCSNGARGFHCQNLKQGNESASSSISREELFYNPVPKKVVERVIELCNANGYAIQYYHEDAIYANAQSVEHRKLTSMYMEYTGVSIEHINDDFKSLLDQNHLPSKLLVLYQDQYSQAAMDIMASELQIDATVVKGYCTWFLEVLSPQVTKGHGLANMCKILNIPLKEVIAIGDGCNDIEFLQMAGLGVAMKNAEDTVKKVADITLDWTNDENGVMQALQQLEGKGQLRTATKK